jgi:8-oxo-dGTP pyrophosphatase MutT (NUDIX family)
MRDVRQLRVPWPDYEFSAPAAPFPVDAIPPPLSYPGPVYVRIPDRGTALVSDAIDRFLVQSGVASELASEPYRLPGPLQASAPYVLAACNTGRVVFNGDVVGMRGDPLPPVPGARAPLRLHGARFFDAQCSNDLCTLRITHRGTGGELDPRRALLTGADGHLRTLAGSVLADAAGVSTLAVTADGAAVLVRQSRHNAASPGLLAPPGSGSLDPRDLGPGRTGILQDILRRGMQRELCEETGIRPGEIRSTIVVGFARWMERGAKPEFSGLTALSVTADDLAGRLPRASGDRLYSGGTLTLRIDPDALGRELAEGAELLTAPGLPPRIREEGSLPLLLAVRAAAWWRARTAAGDHIPR